MEVNCKNCKKLFAGDFCPACGQRVINHRFTVKESITWFFSSIFNLEKGFFHTTWALIKTPGKVISDYTKGITVPYAHPFRFIFVWATITTLVALYTGIYDEVGKMSAGMNEQSAASSAFMEQYMKFLKQYTSVIYMIFIPFFAMGTSIFYRKHKLYFAEHLILNSYSQGVTIAIGLPLTISIFFVPVEYMMLISLISVSLGGLVFSYVNSRFFKENIVLSILKYILIMIVTIVLVSILVIILITIHGLLIKFAGFENVYKALFEGTKAIEAVKVVQ